MGTRDGEATCEPETAGRVRARGLWTVAILLAIVGVRFAYALHWENTLDGDESVVGVMAMHILEGRERPLFFYGQTYMGTLEQYSMALYFKLFGIHTEAVRLIPGLYFLLSLGLFVYLLRVFLYPRDCNVALSFLIFPCLFSTIWCLKARGGFIEAIFLFLLYVVLLFRHERTRTGRLPYLMALVAGFATYVNTLSLPFIVGVTVISQLKVRERGEVLSAVFSRQGALLLVCFLVGFAPALYHAFTGSRVYGVSLGLGLADNLIDRLDLMFLQAVPLAFGVRLPGFELSGPAEAAELVMFLVTAAAFVFSIVKYRRFFAALFLLRRADYPRVFYLVALLPPFLVLWYVSTYLRDIMSYRYMLFAIVLIPIYLTELYRSLGARSRALARTFWALVLMAGLGCSWQFLAQGPGDARYTKTFETLIDHGSNAQPLVDHLQERDLRVGFADPWIQWPLVFLSRENLIYATYWRNRYPPYFARVEAEKTPAHIMFTKEIPDPLQKAASCEERHGVPYAWHTLDRWIIFHPK